MAAPAVQRKVDAEAFLASTGADGKADALKLAYDWYLRIKETWADVEAGRQSDVESVVSSVEAWRGNLIGVRLNRKSREAPFAAGLEEMTTELAGVDREARARVAQVGMLTGIDDRRLEQVQAINAHSIVPYRILHDSLHQSWEYAKEQLATPPRGTNVPVRQALMQKLWKYRDWYTKQTVKAASDALTEIYSAPGGLDPEKTKSAGSTTLTSDIDVNLKGNRTEAAVAVFNRLFKRNDALPGHEWDFEPGIVFDVNVYAMDWMHKWGGERQEGTSVDQASASPATPLEPPSDGGEDPRVQGLERVTANVTVAEGSRKGRKQGGIAGAEKAAEDAVNSDVFSLVKVRLYMTPLEWEEHKKNRHTQPGRAEVFALAEAEYAKYRAAMVGEMRRQTERAMRGEIAAPAPDATGAKDLQGKAATLLYESKVMVIAERRAELKRLVDAYDAAFDGAEAGERTRQNAVIDAKLVEIRRLVLEANLYANEASITHGGVQHGVVGLQGGTRIHMVKSDLLDLSLIHI